MSNFTIDLTNYRENVSAKVDPGRYRLLIEDAELTESSKKDPMIVFYFRVVGGQFDGSTIIERMTLTEKAMFRLVGLMSALGMKIQRKRMRLNLAGFIGKTVDADIQDSEPYRGRINSEVSDFIKVVKEKKAKPENIEKDDEDDEVFEVEEADEDSFASDENDDSDENVDDDLLDELDDL